jgi:hypothetical protein
MDVEYMRKIQQWVECDNKILKFKDQVKDATDKKKELEDEIITYVEEKKYDKLTINITDGNIKFSKRNTTQPLTMKTLRLLLDKYSEQNRNLDTDEILKYISDNLEVKQKTHMLRDVKKTSMDHEGRLSSFISVECGPTVTGPLYGPNYANKRPVDMLFLTRY